MELVDLGLLYDVEVEGPKVKVIHSLTSMGCPAGPMIQETSTTLRPRYQRRGVEVELTLEPPWTPESCPKTPRSFSASVKRQVPVARHLTCLELSMEPALGDCGSPGVLRLDPSSSASSPAAPGP